GGGGGGRAGGGWVRGGGGGCGCGGGGVSALAYSMLQRGHSSFSRFSISGRSECSQRGTDRLGSSRPTVKESDPALPSPPQADWDIVMSPATRAATTCHRRVLTAGPLVPSPGPRRWARVLVP